MSTQFASFLLLYNGRLSMNENFVPTYTGGQNKPLEVPSNTTLSTLKSHVLQVLNYDISTHTVDLVCRLPLGDQYIATNIDDEDVCRIIMRHASSQFLILYVDLQALLPTNTYNDMVQGPSTSALQHTHSFSDIAESMHTVQESLPNSFMPPSYNIQTSPNAQYDTIPEPTPIEDMYETMSSGSSETDSDDFNMPELNEDFLHLANRTSDVLREYCYRSTAAHDCMLANNEFRNMCLTTQEWDAEFDSDSCNESVLVENNLKIPDQLYEGMCFATKVLLLFAVQGWSIINNVEYKVITSNTKKFTAACIHNDAQCIPCKWRLHAALSKRLGGIWKLSTLSYDHSCVTPILQSGHRQCNSNFISYFILPAIRQQVDIKPREIIARMESKFNVRISYMKAWDARRKALKVVFGSWEESYHSIYLFMDAINYAMSGSAYRIQSSQTYRFERIFWAFRPCIEGWNYCRPVLSLDGTFLLGKYRGTLLTAIGIDADNGLFPVAFAIVESECNDSWFWFLRCLRELIPLTTTRDDLCFISDRHSGIVRSCRELYPMAAHRSCLRHLRENFKKAIRRMGIADVEFLCKKMYQAGSTPDIRVFNRHMTDIRTVKEEAYQWLIDRDISRWTLTHDGGYRYGAMTTNAAESFNGVLKRARGLPIQALITAVYYNIISIFLKRRNQIAIAEVEMNSFFSKVTTQNLTSMEKEARQLPEPVRVNHQEFQVFDMSGVSYRVDVLQNGQCRCQCGRPEIYHLPCSHVISCLGLIRRSHFDYVSPYFTLRNHKAAYAVDFHSIPDRSNWSGYDPSRGFISLTPPNYRRRSGRPRARRFKNTMDESTSGSRRKCSNCNMLGHNRVTCPRRLCRS